MTALAAVALFRCTAGDEAGAVALYTVASQNGHVANSRWYQDVVGQHIAAVADRQPANVVSTAQKRGRTQDWRSTIQTVLAEWEAASNATAFEGISSKYPR